MQEREDFAQARARLSERLRLLRISKRISGKELADRVGISPSKLSKIERGQLTPNERDTARIADFLGAQTELRAELVKQARSLAVEWIGQTSRGTKMFPSDQQYIKDIEAEAQTLRSFSTSVIPGRLQTASYTRSLLESIPGFEPETIDAQVIIRQERGAKHHDTTRTFHYLIFEFALMLQIGSTTTMSGQYHHLLQCMRLPNVSVGIIRKESAPPTIISSGFSIADSCVYFDTATAAIALHSTDEVAKHLAVFERVATGAVYDDKAQHIIESYLDASVIDLRVAASQTN